MKTKNKFCILFAGAMGSSKTPIANYLSIKLNLPILNNDSIRTEVRENLGKFNQNNYLEKRNERIQYLLSSGTPFIFDASIDRDWKILLKNLKKFGYNWFIISLDLSKKFLQKIYEFKDYQEFDALDRTWKEHSLFLEKNKNLTGLHITDKNFDCRMQLSLQAITDWKEVL